MWSSAEIMMFATLNLLLVSPWRKNQSSVMIFGRLAGFCQATPPKPCGLYI
jgi:hypothetical protein